MLTINVEDLGNLAVLHLEGRIVAGEESSSLRDVALCYANKEIVVLDLSNVDSIDAGGLGTLLFLHTCTRAVGSELRLNNLSQRVEEILELTRLRSAFVFCSPISIGSDVAEPPRASLDVQLRASEGDQFTPHQLLCAPAAFPLCVANQQIPTLCNTQCKRSANYNV